MSPGTWADEINAAWNRARTAPAIILCASFNGLAIARSLGRRGVPVFAVDSRPWEVGMHSRYVRPLTLPDPSSDPSLWIEFLLAAGRNIAVRPVLFATGDPHLELLSSGREALSKFYAFAIPDSRVLYLLSDKRRQYEYLRARGVELPRTRVSASAEEAAADARELGFPCLAKPAVSYRWVAASGAKVIVVHNIDQAVDSYKRMTAAGSGFLLQELIGGGDGHFYGALCYLDQNGTPRAAMTKRKLRQYPERFGNGCVQISVDEPRLANQSQTIFQQLGYVGLGSIEYKRDPVDQKMKLIEINPRSVSGLQLAIDSGCDLPWLAYQDLTGRPLAPLLRVRHGVIFVNEPWELQRVWRSTPRSAQDWVRCAMTFAGARSFASFSWQDPGPAWSLVKRAFVMPLRVRHRVK